MSRSHRVGRLDAAVRNNAHWCDIVCRAHGLTPVFSDHAWASARRTPELYPDAVTLRPGVSEHTLVDLIDTETPGGSIKDSFCDLELHHTGFSILLEAQWIVREPAAGPLAEPGDVRWVRVRDVASFRSWEAAWVASGGRPDVFVAALWNDPAVAVLVALIGENVVGGVVATTTGTTVGLSNFFSRSDDADVWLSCVAALSVRVPGAAIVGYESGEALERARRSGFSPLGPLRVWIAVPVEAATRAP